MYFNAGKIKALNGLIHVIGRRLNIGEGLKVHRSAFPPRENLGSSAPGAESLTITKEGLKVKSLEAPR